PIRNPRGEIIGAMYVGLPQKPFDRVARRTSGVLLALVGAARMQRPSRPLLATGLRQVPPGQN
ncbi:MAG: hypothetical protein U1E05_02765, partial [Patescibacteria group bacterium]|nr:hypothetical protein [Patescibacteria group bacterium]